MTNLTTFTTVALFVTALVTIQNLLRYLKGKDWNGVLGILVAFIAGVVVVYWAAHSGVTDQLHLIEGGPSLADLDTGSLLLLGLAVGSAGPVLTDTLKAIDHSDSQQKPKLVNKPPAA